MQLLRDLNRGLASLAKPVHDSVELSVADAVPDRLRCPSVGPSCVEVCVDSIANQADVVMASHIVLGETLPTVQTLVTLYTALLASQATFAGCAERAAFFPDI